MLDKKVLFAIITLWEKFLLPCRCIPEGKGMAMILNEINAAAYEKVETALERSGKATVAHATGTGKSCIAWKLVESHPDRSFLWLVSGPARMTLRKADVTRYNNGTLPPNLQLCDCSLLAEATAEQWIALAAKKPDYLIFDCYHELTAACWAKSAQQLLRLCPQAKLLGLTVPNSTEKNCQAAEELFGDAVVSRMTVGEAMAVGTLPVPSNYVAMLWPQEGQLALLRARIKNLHLPAQTNALSAQYEEISWSVRQAENPAALMPRILSDTQGRYLAVFESRDYLETIRDELEHFLSSVDPAVRFYEADSGCLDDSAAWEPFCSDTAPGPKVLLCVNTPGVQQPIEGLAGAILVRETGESGRFRQMLCRALVACGRKPIPIFDLTARFDGLGNGRILQKECTTAMIRAGSEHPGFRQEKPMRQSYHLYCLLKKELEARWDAFYAAAGKAAAKEGNLRLPYSYVTEDGLPLGRWLETQRQVRAGQRPGRLDPERIARLDKLGIEWKQRSELAWEKAFASAQKYRDDHGDLLVPVRYRDRNGFALGEWIVYNRQRYVTGNLTRARIERLESIGMVWNASTDLWEQSYAAAARYYLEHQNLEAPIKYVTPDGFALGVWLSSQRSAYKNGELTPEQIARLEAIGINWINRNVRKWQENFEAAKRYYEKFGNLEVPSNYVTEDGVLLGKWIARQRYAWQNPEHSSARVTPDRKAMLDQIGMIWDKYDPWQERYDLAQEYQEHYGNLEIPLSYKTENGIWLGSWLYRQRQYRRTNDPRLTPHHRKALDELLKDEKPRKTTARRGKESLREKNWERNFQAACQYAEEHGNLLVPSNYVSGDGFRLGVWMSNLRAARKSRPDSFQVTPEHIERLDSIGMEWDARVAKWDVAYSYAADYYAAHGDLQPPATYRTADGFGLGDWVRRMRASRAEGDPKLTEDRIQRLDAIGMEWN